MLPPAQEAAAWFVDTARRTLTTGGSLDVETVLALRQLAPGDAVVAHAIERLDPAAATPPDDGLAGRARYAAAALAIAAASQDEAFARRVVDDLETDLLAAFQPGRTLGTFDDDVAMASLLLDCWDLGHQLPHAMMAEELMLIMLRVHWGERDQRPFAPRAEAARTLLRLHRWSESKSEYYDYGIALLRDLSAGYRQQGLGAAPYVLAIQLIS